MVRGVGGLRIFQDELDKRVFLERARKQFDGSSLTCLVWSLMPNHGHLTTQTGAEKLGTCMHRLETGYASYFNRRLSRQGHVFQNRYKSLLIEEDTYLLRAIRYVLLNPVKGGIVGSLDELETYPWTSYPALMDRGPWRLGDHGLALKLFADDPRAARRELRAWMLDGLNREDPFERLVELPAGRPPELQEALRLARIGERDAYVVGNREFIESILAAADAPGLAWARPVVDRGELAQIVERVCVEFGIDERALRGGRRMASVSSARAALAWIGVTQLGWSQTDLAGELGVSRPALYKALARGEGIVDERYLSIVRSVRVESQEE